MSKKKRHIRLNIKPVNHAKIVAQMKILEIKNEKPASLDAALDLLLDKATIVH